MSTTNSFGQPIGEPVDWQPAVAPVRSPITGNHCRLEPAVPERHAGALWKAQRRDPDGRLWTYLPYGPFRDENDYRAWMEETCVGLDPLFMAIAPREADGAAGVASYLNVVPGVGTIEIGHLYFSPLLQRTCAATEAIFLMVRNAFELGFRRVEWKCDALNAPSRAAAARFGFRYEGTFRQHYVVKGRNRDTAWFSIVDGEWPGLRAAFERWLDPANFDENGRQRVSLSNLTATLATVKGRM
jgi:RimJ/RimL family protein N-acetyltransferase